MYINSINQLRNVYSNPTAKKKINVKNNGISFHAGPNVAVLENKAKIMATIDIMSKNPKVKLPENEIEKKAILEVLEHRLRLNKYVRLRNEAREIRSILREANELVSASKIEEAITLLKELDKRGNVDAILKTLDKQIEQEEKRNLPAIKYFDDIAKTMDEYLEKKLLNNNQIDKAWSQIKKNNINKDENLSIAELIEIINAGEKTNVITESRILSRKDLLATLEKEYEDLMRKGINIYATKRENQELNNNYDKSRNIRYQLTQKYETQLKKYPGIQEALEKIYSKIEKKYTFKVNQLNNIDIYPIGEIWDQMRDVEKSITNITKELPILKENLAKNPNDKTLEMEITGKEVVLAGLRKDWMRGVTLSLKYEAENRERMANAGHLAEYDYLTAKNKTLVNHRKAMEIYKENSETIPEGVWTELIK